MFIQTSCTVSLWLNKSKTVRYTKNHTVFLSIKICTVSLQLNKILKIVNVSISHFYLVEHRINFICFPIAENTYFRETCLFCVICNIILKLECDICVRDVIDGFHI